MTTEKGLGHFLRAPKVFNTEKGHHHYLTVFNNEKGLLKVLILKNASIKFLWILKFFKIATL